MIGYYGGIFQVDRIGYLGTKDTRSHPGLRRKFVKIKSCFDIDWAQASWSDLEKPLYSAIAARLFLLNIPDRIPSDLNGQARYWKKHYNRNGAGTKKKFREDWESYMKTKRQDFYDEYNDIRLL